MFYIANHILLLFEWRGCLFGTRYDRIVSVLCRRAAALRGEEYMTAAGKPVLADAPVLAEAGDRRARARAGGPVRR